jgi:hypothetical protein
MRKVKLGDKNPNFGKRLTPQNKEKLLSSRRGKPSWNKGKKCLSLITNWRGGISTKNNRARHSLETRLWREAVFVRDNFTCQKYGVRGSVLNAHHIQNFSQYPELRFAIDNGITLSDRAHRDFHKKYGQVNNTLEQINEFLNKNTR